MTPNLPASDCTEVEVESSSPEYSKGHHKNEWENSPRLLKPELYRERRRGGMLVNYFTSNITSQT